MRTLTFFPMTSSSVYPNSRSAPGLKASIRPRPSITTMPSTADSTLDPHRFSLAARRRAESADSGKGGPFIRWPRSFALATEIRQDVETARVEPEKLGRDKRLQEFVALVGLGPPQAAKLRLRQMESWHFQVLGL